MAKKLKGVIVSDKMAKTVVVNVARYTKHPLYGKYIKKNKRYKAHDEKNEYKVGDKVIIEECKPLSKDKHWVVVAKI
jgi:small subunit ribosomal protein S17